MSPSDPARGKCFKITYLNSEAITFSILEDNATALKDIRVKILPTGKVNYLVNILRDDWQDIKEIEIADENADPNFRS